MKILSRLKKLETAGNADGRTCACFPRFHTEFYYQNLGKDSTDTEPKLSGETVPDICPKCRRAVIKERINMIFTDET